MEYMAQQMDEMISAGIHRAEASLTEEDIEDIFRELERLKKRVGAPLIDVVEIRQICDLALLALETPRWVETTQFPEATGEYMTTTKNGTVRPMEWDGNKWWCMGGGWPQGYPVAWMPKPAPFTGKKSE